ncbi:hypothetical protein J5N97_024849 [Dioscorea zingiberensis]|uniref:Uncharacterized protein n=1 Tax=Dioscorea zingiberensis TaxID=325984 RepID=A0A9D5C8N9_9LILI|nr:hypothetical protein J5N97_024849 [Dioscorea zingiberensis]
MLYKDGQGALQKISGDADIVGLCEQLRTHRTVEIYVESSDVTHFQKLPEVLLDDNDNDDTHHSPQAEPSQAGNVVCSRVKKKRTEAVNTNVAASRNNASHQVDEDPPTSHISASSIATTHQVDAPPSTNAANLSDKEKRKTKAAWSSDSSVSIFRDAHTGAAIVGRAVSHYTPFMTANELECILTKRREARMKARREELSEQPSASMECPKLLTQKSRIDTATDTNSGQFDLM